MAEVTTQTPIEFNTVPIDSVLGKRVSVIGGGGKTTLARALAEKTGLPFIELDALHWNPNWVESTPDELAQKVTAAISAAPDGWIADGHYWSKIGDLVLSQVDMVVWLDLPWLLMFWRMLRRSFQRAWDKQQICGENTESWRLMLSRDALWWYWVRHPKRMGRRRRMLANLVPAGTPVVRLTSRRDVDEFYRSQGLARAG